MIRGILKREIIDLILKHPPELPMMAKHIGPYNGIRERDFFRKIAFWVFPSIDVTYFAMKIFYMLLRDESVSDSTKVRIKEFLYRNGESINKYVIGNLRSYGNGIVGFTQTLENQYPTLHAFHCTIGLAEYYYVIQESLRGNKRLIDTFRSFQPARAEIENYFKNKKDISKLFLSFVTNCYDPFSGGFRETPKKILKQSHLEIFSPTINATASAILIYFKVIGNLETINFKGYGNTRDNIIDFVEKRRIDRSGKIAFTNSELENDPLVCSTYFAERVLRLLEYEMSEEFKKGFIKFLLSTRKSGSGFSAKAGLDPNIVHTKHALSLIRRYYKEYSEIKGNESERILKDICTGVLKFIKESYIKGGFSFAYRKLYLPNIYATRLAYEIKNSLSEFFFDKVLLERKDLEFIRPDETLDFIFSCYSKEVGAFRGFSYDPKYIHKEYIKEFFTSAVA